MYDGWFVTVPLLDLKAQYAPIREELLDAVTRVCDSQRFIGGPEVEGLERERNGREAAVVGHRQDFPELLDVAPPRVGELDLRGPGSDRLEAGLATGLTDLHHAPALPRRTERERQRRIGPDKVESRGHASV